MLGYQPFSVIERGRGQSSNTVPEEFEVTATSDDGEIMGIRHKKMFIEGVQFHPESILTASGKDLLNNFLKMSAG